MAASPTTSSVDRYEIAYLAGGADRVVDATIVALVLEGRVRVHSPGELATVEMTRRHPVEAAVLDAVGPSGHRSAATVHWRLADDPRLLDLGRQLHARGLVTRFGAKVVRLTGEGRRVLSQARRERPPADDAWRVAFDGRTAMQDGRLRAAIFEPPRHEPLETDREALADLGKHPGSDPSIARRRNSMMGYE